MKKMLSAGIFLAFLSCGPEKEEKVTPSVMPAKVAPEVQQQIDLLNQYPDSLPLRENAVALLDSLGDLREALAQMDALIKKDSLNSGYWMRKGELAEKAGDTSTALRAYRYSLRIYRSPEVLLRAANLLAETKNDTALLIVNSISEEWTDRAVLSHAAFIRGVYYARKGLTEQALKAFDACIRYDYHYLEAYMEKGFLQWEGGNIAAAKKIFTTVIQLKSTYPDGYYWLAKTEARLGDTTNASLHFQQAVRLDPSLPVPAFADEKTDNSRPAKK
ncbi:MAG: tetratricopeptide repeat protein [Bacteroidota bacterium]